jgi:hypothetical protein
MFDQYRHIYSTAFERTPSGFIYYERAWSKGVPVSAAERELYLSGARIDWLHAIVGRKAAMPRRPYWRGVRRIFLAMLWGIDPAEPDGR